MPEKEIHILVKSMFAVETRRPLVEVEIDSGKVQFEPVDARQHAMDILQAADAAESDAFLIGFFGGEWKIDDERLGALIVTFRDYRDKLRREAVSRVVDE